MGIENKTHILAQREKGKITKTRIMAFNTVQKHMGPLSTRKNAYSTYKQKLTKTPDTVKNGTPAPIKLGQALQYPDEKEWAAESDKALQKLEEEMVVDWESIDPKKAKPLPLIMTYIYKWNRHGIIVPVKPGVRLEGI